MRQKFRSRHRSTAPLQGDATPIDLGGTARQIGLFETSIGWQHGFIDILVALGAASMLLPMGAFLRRRRTRPKLTTPMTSPHPARPRRKQARSSWRR